MGFWSKFAHPKPAPPNFANGRTIPEASASWLSRLTFSWLDPLLNVGFSRPLEQDDLWKLYDERHSQVLSKSIEDRFYPRCPPEKRPRAFRDAEVAATPLEDTKLEEGGKDEKKEPVYDSSLFKALHQLFFRRIWFFGALLFFADTLRTTTPLVNEVFLTWLTKAYVWHRLSAEERLVAPQLGLLQPQGVGYGIGIAFGIFAMQEIASIMTNHFWLGGMVTGMYARTSLVGAIFRKSVRLSGKSRNEHGVGKIMTMISTDATNLEMFASFGPYLWVAPIQFFLGLGLLIGKLGYSALVGLGVLVISMPLQGLLVAIMTRQTKKGIKIKDKRIRLMTEVLQGIRLLKCYSWEDFYMANVAQLRTGEIKAIRKSSFALAWLFAMYTFTPIIGAVLSFIVYSLTGHELNVAIIFTALQLFNIIRVPLLMLPLVLQSMVEALVALGRISAFLTAEELEDPYLFDSSLGPAVVIDADFSWESVKPANATAPESGPGNGEDEKKAKDNEKVKEKKKAKTGKTNEENEKQENEKVENVEEVAQDPPFVLSNINMMVPRGGFIAIVGPVGSGKSSILQAILGEMRRTRGSVTVGGSIAYAPQIPWIKNATVRENILFGLKYDEERFRSVLHACALEHDLAILPNGEFTEIGEKGINLSGGQKARISLARATYAQADIVLLDDPLAAVDAYVGKHLLEQCLLSGPLADSTRILVTHSLHVLDKADYIYVVDNGAIIEEGQFEDLMRQKSTFAKLIEEFGAEKTKKGKIVEKNAPQAASYDPATKEQLDSLMQIEERNTGSVSSTVYQRYLRAAGGMRWLPLLMLFLVLNEGANISVTLFLGFWSGNTLPHFTQGKYMAVYACLGVALSITSFLSTYAFALTGLVVSLNLFKSAFDGVLRSPVSFFDTTPIGRIISRFSKDQDIIDAQLPLTMMQFFNILFSAFGTVALIFYTFPILGVIFVPFSILYYLSSVYYRRTSVEAKRLDSILRSLLYASFSETLTGLSTVRAYRAQEQSVAGADRGLDMENRALIITLVMQRWLALRLDLFGNVVILGICLFGAGMRNSVNPAKVGVVLTYSLAVTQTFSEIINLFATLEQSMNAVERLLHYVDLPPEGREETADNAPPDWPTGGAITFDKVQFAYREGLPLVLKSLSFEVKPGEKVGIVGRTGSGKSTLIQALLRVVELAGGRIDVDGVDISRLHLQDLRSRLALVPQDTTLFLGTLRDNLDPQRLRTDAELITILQHAGLLPSDRHPDAAAEAKFSLDSPVSDEGSNYSVGEKQLLALCRALIRNSKIIVLDEATSSVDAETDAKIQRTIRDGFAASTLLCIAHRINTIAHYDRVLVMDDGELAEFDTVLNLYDNEASIFRSLCEEANLGRQDILKIREDFSIHT